MGHDELLRKRELAILRTASFCQESDLSWHCQAWHRHQLCPAMHISDSGFVLNRSVMCYSIPNIKCEDSLAYIPFIIQVLYSILL